MRLRKAAGRLLLLAVILLVLPAWIAIGFGAEVHSPAAVLVFYGQVIGVIAAGLAAVCFVASLFVRG